MQNKESTVIKKKEMDCCPTIEASETNTSALTQISTNEASQESDRCVQCAGNGRPMSRKTVLLMLKSNLLEQAMSGTYSFCVKRDCPVVYFDETRHQSFTVDDLRVRVGPKVKDDPVPLCYCFGFDETHLRAELSETGRTSIPERISNLIREDLCACDTRNPAGVCCLGEVSRAVKRLQS